MSARHVVLLAALLAGARVAGAHALDIGYLRITSDRVVLDLDRAAAAQLLDAPDASPDQLRGRAAELATRTYAREAPRAADGACTLAPPAIEITTVTVRLVAELRCPDGERTWRFPFVTDTQVSPTFELLVKDATTDRMTVVDRASPELVFGLAAPAPAKPPVARPSRPGGEGRSMFLLGGLLVGVMLAPLARSALRR